MSEIEEELVRVQDKDAYFIVMRKMNTVRIIRSELHCDYYGGEIKGSRLSLSGVGKCITYAVKHVKGS